jgi:FkbM family methyltransferase
MPSKLDAGWLNGLSGNKATSHAIAIALKQQEGMLAKNAFPSGETVHFLQLGEFVLQIEEAGLCCAFEVFQEIFLEGEHFKVEGFYPGSLLSALDVGANYGLFALAVKQRWPEVGLTCVEANPYVFPHLQANMVNNGFRDVACMMAAVGVEDGTVPFELLRGIHSISGEGLRKVDRPWMDPCQIETVSVPSVSLGTLLSASSSHHVDLLKMDVEGAEERIIPALLDELKHVGRILVERHSKEGRELLKESLAAQGFKLHYGDMYFIRDTY